MSLTQCMATVALHRLYRDRSTVPAVRRVLLAVMVLSLLVAACSPATDSAGESTAPTSDQGSTSSAGGSSGEDGSTTTGQSGDTTTTSDRPLAPDFRLELGNGQGTYVLSEESKPVFMIFWAEW